MLYRIWEAEFTDFFVALLSVMFSSFGAEQVEFKEERDRISRSSFKLLQLQMQIQMAQWKMDST